MKLDNVLYATQYYRSPTPLENEWEKDLSKMGEFNLNTIQIRINWRNNERKENVYNFDDVDKLLKLAEKYNKKVIIKFLLECAPQYIFDKYDGTRIGPKGEKIRGGSHGAFYAGGWLPCFQNQKVKERAIKFVKEVVKRYKDNDQIILWNAWNEPRNKPIEECFCPECRKGFGEYLKSKFGTIENLNKFYGVCEESFESIALPSMAHGYWDIFEFKKFKSEQGIFNNLKFVYDAIRSLDTTRPVISHSGYPAAFQCSLGDCLSDNFASKAVDMWGTSVPCDTRMDTLENRLEFNKLNDYLYSVSKDYILYEMYPGLGMYRYPYDNNWDMKYKLFLTISKGSKGVNFWQYRSERVGHENDCAGLARMDGTPREVLNVVKEFGDFLNIYGTELINSYKPQNDIAILFDYDSLLLSEIEDSCGKDYSFDQYWNLNYYLKSHTGLYNVIRKNNFDVDYLQTANIKDIFKYKIVFIPNYSMLKPEVMKALKEFVNKGGYVFADEGFGLRDENTWINPYEIKSEEMFKAQLLERRLTDSTINFDNIKHNTRGYKTNYELSNSTVISTFDDGKPAIQYINYGLGRFYLSGIGVGYNSSFNDSKIGDQIVQDITKSLKIRPSSLSNLKEGIECNKLISEDKKTEIYFVFNTSEKTVSLSIDKDMVESYNCKKNGNKFELSPKDVCVFKKRQPC